MRCFMAIVILVNLVAIGPAVAAEQILRLDPGATQIGFLLESTFHDVHGTLFLDRGEIRFDMESGEAAGEIVLDARRTVSGNTKRDKKMHKKVLVTKTFPEIRFRADRVEGRRQRNDC